jgi:glycosyltransferase involved in cell wall biosynthesis
MPTVGLVMIVKNEAAVIERALLSVKPFISTWLIVDTGSTDTTKNIIKRVMSDISGTLVDRPWVNFGHNRSEALALCDSRMDWAIMLDADDNLAGSPLPLDLWNHTELDGIAIRIQHGPIWHQRVHIFRTGVGWFYQGVLHEYPICKSKPQPRLAILPQTTYMVTRCEGARSQDPNKYKKDAALLEAEVQRNPTDSRSMFYLAQSYRDAGLTQEAIAMYLRYVDLSGNPWNQERYMAYVNLITLSVDTTKHMAWAWAAVELCPQRLEAQFTVLTIRRQKSLPPTQEAFALASITKSRKIDTSGLFINPAIYEWGMDDELAVVAFATGHYQVAYDASIRCALAAPTVEMRENALKNARTAKERLAATV